MTWDTLATKGKAYLDECVKKIDRDIRFVREVRDILIQLFPEESHEWKLPIIDDLPLMANGPRRKPPRLRVVDMIEDVLLEAGRPLGVREIAAGFVRHGEKNHRNLVANIRATLFYWQAKGRFRRVGRGAWEVTTKESDSCTKLIRISG